MRYFLFVFTLLTLYSCGSSHSGDPVDETTGTDTRQFSTSDPEFEAFKADFENYAAMHNLNVSAENVPINFGNLDNLTSGESIETSEASYSHAHDHGHHNHYHNNNHTSITGKR